VLYYDQYQKIVGWGPDIIDALAPTGYPKLGVQKVEWIKLRLMKLLSHPCFDPLVFPPLPSGKSEVDVIADYLSKLRHVLLTQHHRHLGNDFTQEESSVRYVFAVPCMWNDAAKAATREAIVQAGFVNH